MPRPEIKIQDLLSNWTYFKWRIHGIGLLQAYLPDPWKDCRLHVWHRSLVSDGIEESGAMHNHRMHVLSQVLVGELINQMLYPIVDKDGEWQIWELSEDKAMFELLTRARMRAGQTEFYKAGGRYLVPKSFYHQAKQPPVFDDVTITLVDLLKKDNQVPIHIITPEDRVPVNAKTGKVGTGYKHVLQLAHKRLRDLRDGGNDETY